MTTFGSDDDLLMRLGVALAIGLLVGLERGWHTRDEPDHMRPAGLRTFALTGLMGGVAGAISLKLGGLVLAAAFLAHALAFIAFHWLEAQKEGDLGVTTVVAGMLTFMLGAMALAGEVRLAIVSAVAMTLLLALRERLHRWVASITSNEINAVLTLVAMSFLLLPLLPNRAVDPWQALNPYVIWLMAVMIAAISFGGYVAVKVFGEERGVMVMAIAGGLASSTAVTLSFSKLGHEHPESARLLSAGILLSGLTMFVRVAGLAGVLNGGMLMPLAVPLAAAGLATLIGIGLLLLGTHRKETPQLEITNPLELGPALKLAMLIVVIMLAAKILKAYAGDAGILGLAAVSGIADVDAITLSMAKSGGVDMTLRVAALAVLTAVAVNTISKSVLAWISGGSRIGLIVSVVNAAAIGAGGAATFLL